MDAAEILVALETIRTNPTYRAAEIVRRKTVGGSGAMAHSSPESEEHRAVLLLISTWDVIAQILADASDDTKKRVFEVLPVCHMYRALQAALEALGECHPGFGEGFGTLNTAYETWLKGANKDAKYISAACGGLHARFG